MAQHDILIRSLERVAGDAKDEDGGWKIKLIIFVGGTSGSGHVHAGGAGPLGSATVTASLELKNATFRQFFTKRCCSNFSIVKAQRFEKQNFTAHHVNPLPTSLYACFSPCPLGTLRNSRNVAFLTFSQ
jgi:hypothetical protein